MIRDISSPIQGFGLTIGSDLSILFVNHKHYNSLGVIKSSLKADIIHGVFTATNASNSTSELSFAGTLGFINATNSHVSRGWSPFTSPHYWPQYPVTRFLLTFAFLYQGVTATQNGPGTASRSLGGRCSSWYLSIRPAPPSRICSLSGALACLS